MNHYKGFRTYLTFEKGRAESTMAAYIGDLERFEAWLEPYLGTPLDWQEVAVSHVRNYLSELSASPSYYHRVHSSISVFFDYLMNVAEVITTNPAAKVNKPKLRSRLPETLNLGELERLINTAAEHSRPSDRVRNWAMIAFLAGTGLRVSEFVGMNMSDIKQKEGYPYSVDVIGKGDKQRRVVLTESAKTALYQWLKARKYVQREIPLELDRDAVWLNTSGRYRGKRMSTNGIRRIIEKMGRLAGIKKRAHPHMLRHTMGTELARHKASLHAIRDTLGHSNLATTSRYLHADTEELEAMAAALPDFTQGRQVKQRRRLPGEQVLFEEVESE